MRIPPGGAPTHMSAHTARRPHVHSNSCLEGPLANDGTCSIKRFTPDDDDCREGGHCPQLAHDRRD
jgi:hypothetical protein